MSSVRLIYHRPRLAVLAIMLIIVAGLSAVTALPRQEDPVPRERFGNILTYFPGASAERIESLVVEKLEDRLFEIEEVREVQATARTSVASIFVELDEDVKDTNEVWSRIRDKIEEADAEMPTGVGSSELEVQKLPAVTLLVSLTSADSGEQDLAILSRLAKELENRLRTMSGTEQTEIYGEADEEVLITIDPAELAGLGLSVADISNIIAASDAKSPAGLVYGEADTLGLEVYGEIESLDRLSSLPVAERPGGLTLRLGDIATIEKAERTPPATMALINGERAVVVSALMEQNQRVDQWSTVARGVVEDFAATLPPSITAEILIDQSVYTQKRLIDLAQNFLFGVVLVVGVLFIALGWRSAILVGAALPLTVAMVLGVLWLLGIPLHQMSVTGLIIALGLLIDNAIVVIDDYNLARSRGLGVLAAGEKAVGHLTIPLLASTVTTALTFAPIMLAPGAVGDFIGTMGLAVILSIFSSLALSLTILAPMAGYMDRRFPTPEGKDPCGWSHERLSQAYRKSLDWVIAKPGKAIGLVVLMPLTGFVLAGQLPEQFFPPVDRDQFQMQLTLSEEASIEETRRAALRVDDVLAEFDGVDASYWFIGEGAPKAFYNALAFRDGVASFAGAIVETEGATTTREIARDLQARLMAEVPDAEILALPFEQGPPVAAPLEVRIFGSDFEVLKGLGEEARAILATTRNVTYTRSRLAGGRPKVELVPDEEQARLAGLTLTQVSQQLRSDLEGATGGTILEDIEELPIRVRLGGADRSEIGNVLTRTLVPAGGTAASDAPIAGVPLSAIATPSLVPETPTITRKDGERYNLVQAFIVPFTLPSEAAGDFQRRLEAANLDIPAGYRIEFGGEGAERDEATGGLASSVPVLLVLMAGTVILSFNSFRAAGIIAAVAFLSVGFAFLSLWVFRQPMGFMAIVGAMGLIGLSINGAIVVLSALRANGQARAGDPAVIRDVVTDATRHIVATTFTTIGGFIPLILFADSFWQPLSIAIAGGVVGSAILALYFVTALFTLTARGKARRKAKQRGGSDRSNVEQFPAAAEFAVAAE